MFTNIGYIWRPAGRTFTIVGNTCPLTRITTTIEVPLRKSSALDNKTPKPVVTLVYSRKPRRSKTSVPINNYKVVQIVLWYLDSGCSKNMTKDRSQLTNFVNKFLGTIKFGNDHVAKIMGYGDYQNNGTEFVNQTLPEYYEKIGISHEISVARSPHQNGVVERRNSMLIEAARTILIYAKAHLFLWAEAVATAYALIKPVGMKQCKEDLMSFDADFKTETGRILKNKASISSPVVTNMDVKTAFLNGLSVGRGLKRVHAVGPRLGRLRGCVRRGGAWLCMLSSFLISQDFSKGSVDPTFGYSHGGEIQTDEDKEGKAVDPSHYRGMIGTPLYLIQRNRYIGDYWYRRILRLRLTAFADADHAVVKDTRHGTV
ncbi:retrovirus-related pol polyprotein from transposon TNT 1-94 [Tanacetum coccineum]